MGDTHGFEMQTSNNRLKSPQHEKKERKKSFCVLGKHNSLFLFIETATLQASFLLGEAELLHRKFHMSISC